MNVSTGTPERPLGASPERPLRADAERNRLRIVEAAAALLAARGIEVTLDDVAAHAGLGVGTVYRRFANKQELIDAVFENRLEVMVEAARTALLDPHPWDSLTGFLEFLFSDVANNRGFGDIVVGSDDEFDRIATLKSRLEPLISQLIDRAKASGDLRSDVYATDFFVLTNMVRSAADCSCAGPTDTWRRYVALLVDGLRERGDRTDDLPGRPLTPAEISKSQRRV